jgi:hypothetical protein
MNPKFKASMKAAQRIKTAANKRRAVLYWCKAIKKALS